MSIPEKFIKNYSAEDYIKEIYNVIDAARKNGLKVFFECNPFLGHGKLVVENTCYTGTHTEEIVVEGFGRASITMQAEELDPFIDEKVKF